MKQTNPSKFPWFWYIIGLGLTMIVVLLYCDHTLNSDEGVVLNAAWQLWHGKRMYVDFADFTAPGSAYSVYWVWKIIGQPSYLSAKVFSLVFLGVAMFVLARIVYRETRNRYLTVVAAVLWIILVRFYPVINHNTYSSLAAIITLGCLWKALDQSEPIKRYWWFGVTGGMSGIVAWYLQTKGAAIFFACLVSLVAYKKYRASGVVAVTCLFTLVLLLRPWSLIQLWQSWFILPLQSQYLAYTIIWWPVLVVEVGVIVLMLYGAKKQQIKHGYMLVLWQGVLFASAGYLVDISHFLINSFPALILIVLWCHQFPAKKERALYSQVVHGLALGIPILIFSTFNLVSGNTIFAVDILHKPNDGWRNFLALGEQADAIYAGPFLPSVYFELRKPNPFTASHNMVLCDVTCQQTTIKTLELTQPKYAIMNYAMVQKYQYQPTQPIDRYIQEHYHMCEQPVSLGSMQVYTRSVCPKLSN